MKQSIGNDALLLTTSKIITMTISMVSAMLLSRFLTLEEYGTYSQLLLVVNLIATVFMLGLPNSINFFLAKAQNQVERQTFLSIYYTLSTLLSFLVGLVLVLSTSLIVGYFKNPLISSFMYVLAILPWANIILSSIENVLIVYRKTTYLILFRVLNSIFLLLIIVFVRLLNLGFTAYMILFISVEVFFVLSVYLIVRNISGKLKFSFEKSIVKKILNFSLPIGLASVIGVLSIQLDKLIIGKLFSTAEIAIYTNAARELPIVFVASSLTSVLMPQLVTLLSKNKVKLAITMWGDANAVSYTIICFFSIATFVFAPEVISLLYSEKYLPGTSVFRIYTLVLLLRFTYFGMVLNSIGKTKLILYSSVTSLILNVLLSYVFYLLFGFVGPALATFISIAAVQIFQLIATSKSIDISFASLFPWRVLGVITLINILMGMFFAFLKEWVPMHLFTGEIMKSIFLGLLWGIIYFLIMIKFIKGKWDNLNSNL